MRDLYSSGPTAGELWMLTQYGNNLVNRIVVELTPGARRDDLVTKVIPANAGLETASRVRSDARTLRMAKPPWRQEKSFTAAEFT